MQRNNKKDLVNFGNFCFADNKILVFKKHSVHVVMYP